MKILKKTNNQIEFTKPFSDLARECNVEIYFEELEDILRVFSNDDDNAYIDYKVKYNPFYMKDFTATFDYQYEMEEVKNIPQSLKTRKDYKDLFIAIQLAFKVHRN